MGYFLVYILKSSFCLILFYLFYRLFLCRETFFRFNRMVLLGMLAVALVIPFIHLTIEQPTLIQKQAIDLEALLLMANEAETDTASWNPYLIFFYIYFAGLIGVLFQMIHSVIRIRKLIRTGRRLMIAKTSVYLLKSDIEPFSWMNKIVLSEKDYQENGKEIFTHEKAHISSGHAYDLIVVNSFILFQWFNPAVWLLKQELQSLHEYEADEAVLKQGIDAKRYQLLLIKKAVGSQRFTSVANSFNQSKLKNRITMMLKQKSTPWEKLKLVGFLPLAAIAVTAFARPEVSNEFDKLSAVKITAFIPEEKTPENEMSLAIADTVVKKDKQIRLSGIPENVVFIVDDEEKTAEEVRAIDPKDIEHMEVIKKTSEEFMRRFNLKNKQGVILITTRRTEAPKLRNLEKTQDNFYKNLKAPLVLVNGEVFKGDISRIDPSNIESMSVVKKEEALTSYVEKYGIKAQNGVIRIELKK